MRCRIGNNQKFRFLRLLAENEGQFLSRATIAEKLTDLPDGQVKSYKSRLCKELREEGMQGLADSIRTEFDRYGLFLP